MGISLLKIEDQLQRKIILKSIPKRIVSLVPSQTELLYDLGLGDSVVGVTKFCVHPNHAITESTLIGGTKQIKLEKIKALKPDIILCNKEENTQAIVEACEQICNVHVSDIETIQDCIVMIQQYGEMFNVRVEALNISESIQKELTKFKTFIADKGILKVVYFIWKKPWMVAGANTFISHLLELNKFENIYANVSRYPEIDLNLQQEDVDVVLLSSEPYPFKNSHKEELKTHYTKAKIELVDGEMFSWYGSRLIKAFDYFKRLRVNL